MGKEPKVISGARYRGSRSRFRVRVRVRARVRVRVRVRVKVRVRVRVRLRVKAEKRLSSRLPLRYKLGLFSLSNSICGQLLDDAFH